MPSWPFGLLLCVCILPSTAFCSNIYEDYSWSCRLVAERRDWGIPNDLSAHERQAMLSKSANFLEFYSHCILMAISNDPDPLESLQEIQNSTPYKLSLVDFSDLSIPGVQKMALQQPDKLRELKQINLTDPAEFHAAMETALWRQKGDDISFRCGLAILLFWVVVSTISFAWGLFTTLMSPHGRLTNWIRTRLIIPSIIGGKKSRFRLIMWARGLRIQYPSPILIVTVACYALLNFCLLFLCYPAPVCENFMFTTETLQFYKCMAVRGAFLTVWSLPIMTFFASRNNPLHVLLDMPFATCMFFHRWIARITIANAVVHAAAISVVKVKQGWYGLFWKVDFWQWGVVALATVGVIGVQSFYWLRRSKFEIFRWLHILLAVVVILSTWYHVKPLPYGWGHVLAMISVWCFDYLVRAVRIFCNGCMTATVVHLNNEYSAVTYRDNWFRRRLVVSGSFAFFHFAFGPWGLFGLESHPFTTIHLESGESMICVRHKRGATSRLAEADPKVPLKLWLDGPYGTGFRFKSFDHVILIAAGAGASAAFSYLSGLSQYNSSQGTNETQSISLHWALANASESCWPIDILKRYKSLVDIFIYSEKNICSGLELENKPEHAFGKLIGRRLSCEDVIAKETRLTQGSVGVYVCGGDGLRIDARRAVCEAIYQSNYYVGYFEEVSEW